MFSFTDFSQTLFGTVSLDKNKNKNLKLFTLQSVLKYLQKQAFKSNQLSQAK